MCSLILVLMYSLFQSLPRSIGKLKRLSNFNCDRNQLTSLPKEVRFSCVNQHNFTEQLKCAERQLRHLKMKSCEYQNCVYVFVSLQELKI